MAVAIPFGTRQQIVQMREQGKSYQQISQQLGVSYDAVRRICKRQQQQGEAALLPNYKRCGIEGIRRSAFYHRVSLWLKRAHPLWGAPYIRLQLDTRYGRVKEDRKLVDAVLRGLSEPIQVKNQPYTGVMPAFSFLTDQELADVLSYIRQSFGNQHGTITYKTVEKMRAEPAKN